MSSKKEWIMEDGTATLIPKSEGEGRMIYAYQGPITGFGLGKISAEDLKKINAKRNGNGVYLE